MSARGDGAFPSQTFLAKRAGISDRSVRTHLGIAERDGWIVRHSKRSQGQLWRKHSYDATIPVALIKFVREAPWAKDPEYRRAAPTSTRELNQPGMASDAEGPSGPQPSHKDAVNATQAKLAESDAKGPETGSGPSGTNFPYVRNQVPINSSCNHNLEKHTPSECAPKRTGEHDHILRNENPGRDGRASEERVKQCIAKFPTYSDADIAKLAHTTVDVVLKLRSDQWENDDILR